MVNSKLFLTDNKSILPIFNPIRNWACALDLESKLKEN
jgi:hypothetical protein